MVSTNLPAVCSFNQEHDVVLTSAAIKRRRDFAARGNWQTRIEAMSAVLESALEAKEKQTRVASLL